jgi:hypothetical protein
VGRRAAQRPARRAAFRRAWFFASELTLALIATVAFRTLPPPRSAATAVTMATTAAHCSGVASGAARCARPIPEIHRVDPETGSTLRILYGFSVKLLGQLANFWVNPVNLTFEGGARRYFVVALLEAVAAAPQLGRGRRACPAGKRGRCGAAGGGPA